MNLAVLGSAFAGWTGGVEFIKAYLPAIRCIPNIKIYLLIDDSNGVTTIKGALKIGIKRFVGKKVLKSDAERQISLFADEKDVNIIKYNNCKKETNLISVVNKYSIDVIFPTLQALGSDFPVPWVPYIYDFQHKYLPDFFTPNERVHRDGFFEQMLYQSKCAIVEARAVKEDIERFYPASKTNVFVMPYTAVAKEDWFDLEDVNLEQYNLPKNYFLISNQFWLHKSHKTAFEALWKLYKNGNSDWHIVCTGNTKDYRNPNYMTELSMFVKNLGINDNVHVLGFVPKLHQMKIMLKSKAVIQPTLFEGNPGGGIAYNAMALGHPIILSDINVNKEFKFKNARFFRAGNSDSLCQTMKEVIKKDDFVHYSKRQLEKASEKRLQKLTKAIEDVIFYATKC